MEPTFIQFLSKYVPIHQNKQQSVDIIINSTSKIPSPTAKFIVILLIISLFITHSESQTWQPMTMYKHQFIESRTLTLVSTTSTSHEISVTFTQAFPSIPQIDNIFYALQSIKYSCNYFVNSNRYKMLTQIVTPIPTSSSSLNLKVTHVASVLKMIKISLMIFAQQYQNLPFIQSDKFTYINGGTLSHNIVLLPSTPIVLPHITMINIVTGPHGDIQFYPLLDSFSSLSQRWNVTFPSSYTTGQITIGFLLIYPDLMSIFTCPSVYIYRVYANPTGLNVSKSLTEQNPSKSSFFGGMIHFSYSPLNNINNRGVYWQTFQTSSTNQRIDLDNQMNSFLYGWIIFNTYGCRNPLFPFRFNNITLGEIVCLSSCPIGTGSQYSTQYNAMICFLCDTLCEACSNSTVCYQCKAGYELDSTFSCVLKPAYFTNATGVYTCSTILSSCQTCTSDGLTCLACIIGYSVNSGNCLECQTVVTNCKKCTSTMCVQCFQTYTLVTSLKCLIVLPPSPPTPPIPLICTSDLCQTCNGLNLSECLICKSGQQSILINGKCIKVVCGDEKIDWNETCDDGNTYNYDGCSSDCMLIEQSFICDKVLTNISVSQLIFRSDCYYKGSINISMKSIKKIQNDNKIQILLINHNPKIRQWQKTTQQILKSIFKLSLIQQQEKYIIEYSLQFYSQDKIRSINTIRLLQQQQFKPQNYQYIKLFISYVRNQYYQQQQSLLFNNIISLNHQEINILINTSRSNLSVFRSSSYVSQYRFYLITDDNIMIEYYSPQIYQYSNMMYLMGMVISIIFDMMIILSIVLYFIDNRQNSNKLWIVLQGVFIIQYSYYSFIGIGQLNPLFHQLAQGLKYSSGYDIILTNHINNDQLNSINNKQLNNIHRQLSGIYIQQVNFSNNINLSLFIIIGLLIMGIIILLINKYKHKLISQNKLTNHNNKFQSQQQQIQKNKQQSKSIIHQLQGQQIQIKLQSYQQQVLSNKQQVQSNKQQIQQNKQQVQQNKQYAQSNKQQQVQPNKQQNMLLNNQQLQSKKLSQSKKQSQLNKLPQLLIGNFAFTILLFCLYKFIFFSFIQLQQSCVINKLDIVLIVMLIIILIVYIILLITKRQIFNSLTQKIKKIKENNNHNNKLSQNNNNKLSQNNNNKIQQNNNNKQIQDILKEQSCYSNKNKKFPIKTIYPLLIMIQHLINILILIKLYKQLYWNICPIIIHILFIILINKYPLYNNANKYRFITNHIIGIIIQSILLSRHIMFNQNIIHQKTQQQTQLSIYLPFTIITLLILLSINTIIYFIYSIKIFRCCQLSIQSEHNKKNQNQLLRNINKYTNYKLTNNNNKNNNNKYNLLKINLNINSQINSNIHYSNNHNQQNINQYNMNSNYNNSNNNRNFYNLSRNPYQQLTNQTVDYILSNKHQFISKYSTHQQYQSSLNHQQQQQIKSTQLIKSNKSNKYKKQSQKPQQIKSHKSDSNQLLLNNQKNFINNNTKQLQIIQMTSYGNQYFDNKNTITDKNIIHSPHKRTLKSSSPIIHRKQLKKQINASLNNHRINKISSKYSQIKQKSLIRQKYNYTDQTKYVTYQQFDKI